MISFLESDLGTGPAERLALATLLFDSGDSMRAFDVLADLHEPFDGRMG